MAVATPLSLSNIVTEFGEGILSSETYNSGSGSVTAPAAASGVRIKVWGGGGGGENGGEFNVGGGGGGAGFSMVTLAVTGGSTAASYSVGTGGAGNSGPAQVAGGNGTSSSVTIGATTLTAGGGFGGDLGVGGSAGTATGGDVNESGVNGSGDGTGGAAGGTEYGGGGGSGAAPGSGGVGGQYDSGSGANGRVVFDWLFKGLSTYARGTGEIPSHSANANIPTSTTNLAIAQFNGAEKNFTATIISADISAGTRGFEAGLYGSIDRDQVGLNRNNTSTTTLLSWTETQTIFYDLLGFPSGFIYPQTIKFSGDVRSATLGYHFFTLAEFATQTFDGTNTTFGTSGSFSPTFGADGSSNPVTLIYGGP